MSSYYDPSSVTRMLFLLGVVRLFLEDLINYLNNRRFAERTTYSLKLFITTTLISATMLANFLNHTIDRATFIYTLGGIIVVMVATLFSWYLSDIHDSEIEILEKRQYMDNIRRLEQKIDRIEKLIAEK